MIEKLDFVCLGFHQTVKSFIEHVDPESCNVAVASFVQHLQKSFFSPFWFDYLTSSNLLRTRNEPYSYQYFLEKILETSVKQLKIFFGNLISQFFPKEIFKPIKHYYMQLSFKE